MFCFLAHPSANPGIFRLQRCCVSTKLTGESKEILIKGGNCNGKSAITELMPAVKST